MRRAPDLRNAAILTAGSALVTFPKLDLQSWDRDEAYMADRVMQANLFDTLGVVGTETSPPLWYFLAWGWTTLFGTGEAGLRSLSALAATATVSVVYFIGKELASRRVGFIAGCLFAVNPFLYWFSQEGRPYALLVFLTALSFLFFVRALGEAPSRRDLAWWALASALAMATHYFAVFVVVPEAIWLLWRSPDRRAALLAVAAVGAAGAALAPLALHQSRGGGHWISGSPLDHRLRSAAEQYMVGVTGRQLARIDPAAQKAAVLVGVAGILLVLRADRAEWRAARLGVAIGGAAVLLPIALSFVGADYVLDKNMIPVLVPLGMALAVGLGVRRARLVGALAAVALCAVWLSLVLQVIREPSHRRPDWRQAADVTGLPSARRAIVAPFNGDFPLEAYRGEWRRMEGRTAAVGEVVVIGWTHPTTLSPPLPPGFQPVERRTLRLGGLARFRSDRPRPIERHALASTQVGGLCSPDVHGVGCEYGVVWLDGPR
jgi:mannosyltransferase